MFVFFIVLGLVSTALCDKLNDFEKQHMRDAHHIEVTDEVTFFKLHDIDKDGYWSEQELQAIYGIERDVDPNAPYIKSITDKIYESMDKNKDRFISLQEYIVSTLPGLTNLELEKEQIYKQEKKKSKGVGGQQKVIQPEKKKKKKTVEKEKLVFQQQGANYIPSKFRA